MFVPKDLNNQWSDKIPIYSKVFRVERRFLTYWGGKLPRLSKENSALELITPPPIFLLKKNSIVQWRPGGSKKPDPLFQVPLDASRGVSACTL